MRKVKAAECVLDFDLYPRHNVDTTNVKHIVNALSAGVEVPPIIIDKKSKRVTDGFHRVKAHLYLWGDDAEIMAVEKEYKNEKDMFLDAMRYNATHGAKLDSHDRTHCTIIAQRLRIPLDDVAAALHMPKDKLGELKHGRTATAGGLTIPLKNTVRSFAGKALTKRQVEANQKLSGMNQTFYVNQLIELLESKMLDLNDDRLIERMKLLHELLDDVLAVK